LKPGMEYQVDFTDRANRDLDLIYIKINAEHSVAALNWYRNLKRSIHTLAELPNRCPITRKQNELRHLLFGNRPHVYRVIFRVVEREKCVIILTIRHAARRSSKAIEAV
jgi:toxin ParE1/3/4